MSPVGSFLLSENEIADSILLFSFMCCASCFTGIYLLFTAAFHLTKGRVKATEIKSESTSLKSASFFQHSLVEIDFARHFFLL